MAHLSQLLEKFQRLTREHVAIETQLAEVQQEILGHRAAVAPCHPAVPRRRRRVVITEQVKDVVKVLRDAGGPLRRQEIGNRLNITSTAASFRLRQAVKHGFVVSTGYGYYKIAETVPAL